MTCGKIKCANQNPKLHVDMWTWTQGQRQGKGNKLGTKKPLTTCHMPVKNNPKTG
jgi:hypothetical protein